MATSANSTAPAALATSTAPGGLKLADLPSDSTALFIWSEDGADVGIGTAEEARQLVEEGIIHNPDAMSFRPV